MADELNLQKKQQLEAIKLMSDWSKWLITIETGGIAGIVSLIKFTDYSSNTERLWSTGISLFLFISALCFVFSIYNACLLVFSLPYIVENLATAQESSIDNMKDPYMPHKIVVFEARQYKSFVAGLVTVATALVLWMAWSLLAEIHHTPFLPKL